MEGAEYFVLDALDFNKINVGMFVIERPQSNVVNLLASNGYNEVTSMKNPLDRWYSRG